jgi:flagellar hook-associated protein 3 FlgL
MRVTSNTFPDELVSQLQTLQQRQIKAERSIATGQRLELPSDDPAAFLQSIQLQSSQRIGIQFKDTIRQITARTNEDYSATTQLQAIVTRASELAIRSNGTLNQSEFTINAKEMNQLLEQAVALGNRQYNGQFQFGGTYLQPNDLDGAVPYVPFRVTRNVTGDITTVTYRGNEVVSQVNIETNSTIETNVIGSSATGTPRGLFINNGVDIFAQLITLRDQLLAGNYQAVNNPGVSNLRLVEDNVATQVGFLAANLGRLNVTKDSHDQKFLSDSTSLSAVIDTDIAQAATLLRQTQTAFEAALQTGARIFNLSLLNYLQ